MLYMLSVLMKILLSHAKPFKCLVEPRSEKAAHLIQFVEDEHPFDAGDSDPLKAL